MTFFVWLDVSLEQTAICIVDRDGQIVREGKFSTGSDVIVAWLKQDDGSAERIGLETGPLSPWLHESLKSAGLPAICIETRRMKGATAAMSVKTDGNDARAIAHLICPVHLRR